MKLFGTKLNYGDRLRSKSGDNNLVGRIFRNYHSQIKLCENSGNSVFYKIGNPVLHIHILFTTLQESSIAEVEVRVKPKYHNHFVAHRGQVLREIDEEFGGVTVSFPPQGSKSDRVTIKGAKDCLEGAKKRILKIVEDLVR